MTSILHLSDTHFGTEVPQVVQALTRHVQAHPADLLILSGDITQRARPSQFAAARTFICSLQKTGIAQTLTIPGNHDIPLYNIIRRFLRPYAHYQAHFGSDLEPCFENEDMLVIGLNTTHPKRHKNGRITQGQIAAVQQRLSASSTDKVRILVAHQPFGAMVNSDTKNLQIGASEALSQWQNHHLDIIMGGHIHLPYVRPLSMQYPLDREIWAVQAGTATSSRIRRAIPNSFNRLKVIRHADQSKQVLAERWDYQEGSFQLGACLELDWKKPVPSSR